MRTPFAPVPSMREKSVPCFSQAQFAQDDGFDRIKVSPLEVSTHLLLHIAVYHELSQVRLTSHTSATAGGPFLVRRPWGYRTRLIQRPVLPPSPSPCA